MLGGWESSVGGWESFTKVYSKNLFVIFRKDVLIRVAILQNV